MKTKNTNSRNGKYGVINTYDIIANNTNKIAFDGIPTRKEAREIKNALLKTFGFKAGDLTIIQTTTSIVR